MKPSLIFLKLGGSFLGDKRKPRSFRSAAVERVGREIRRVLERRRNPRILIGHGGGGAAHCPAREFRTREGLSGGGGWQGFAETRRGVMWTNRRVLDALARADLHPVLVPPVAGVVAQNGKIRHWDVTVIEHVLEAGQVPMIHGDVVLDRKRGFTICSTEELFAFLVGRLRPNRIVLACDVEGVYLDGPSPRDGVETCALNRRVSVVQSVERTNIAAVRQCLRRAAEPSGRGRVWDVTGGMLAKVEQLYAMARRCRGLETRIVSGLKPGAVEAALLGKEEGTAVR